MHMCLCLSVCLHVYLSVSVFLPPLHCILGWTPLHEACNHGHSDVVSVLIDKGANVNALGMDGDTPLHDAVINNHTQVMCSDNIVII